MPISPINKDLTAGLAGQYAEELTPELDGLLTGDLPPFGIDTVETVLANQTLAARTVVGFDADGKIVPAVMGSVDPDDDVQAIGVLVYAINTTSTGTNADTTAHVWRSGCLNPDLLVWPASYDTAAKRAKAFEGAPSPTQIIIRPIATFSV